MRFRLAAVLLALALAGGALAGSTRSIRGTPGPDRLIGTPGADAVFANAGDDLVAVEGDAAHDSVSCGGGRDVVTADLVDRIATDCEVVSRQLSRDTFNDPSAQHQTQVEPDDFAYGNTVVAVFQSGRFVDGASDGIGYAASSDAGRSWHAGFLPGLAGPGQTFARVSDPVVAYDALHGVWLAASLGVSPGRFGLAVNRSPDGWHWQPAVIVADSAVLVDKDWIVCDNGAASPFRGSCYLSYLDGSTGVIATRASRDGGLTWSAPVTAEASLPSQEQDLGAVPLVRPDGTVVIPFLRLSPSGSQVVATRSTDGGATFTPPVPVADQRQANIPDLRAPALPSAEIAQDGTIYIAWADCRFTPSCSGNGMVYSSSADGIAWTAPAAIPVGPASATTSYFVPGLGVDAATAGSSTRLALVYYSIAAGTCGSIVCAGIDAWLVTSADTGATWTKPQRLDTRTITPGWLARSDEGAFLGDYLSTAWVAGRPVPVFGLAAPPGNGKLHQAIFATTRLSP